VLTLALMFLSGTVWPARAADVWIKDTTHDLSSWPKGFPLIPQPASDKDVDRIDGSGESALDTDFDAIMRKKGSAFTTVYLGPGLFKTRGTVGNVQAQGDSPGFRLQDHSRLIGSGKAGSGQGGTTLRLVAVNEWDGALVVGANEFDYWDDDTGEFLYTTASDIWVTDLEIDCNGPEITKVPGTISTFDPTHSWYLQGIQLWGTGACHIERVHVKNAVGADIIPPLVENFILCINTPPGVSTDNVILDCSVTDFYNPTGNGACSAISMNRWDHGAGSIQGLIQGCEVVLNGERGWGYGGEFAYNASSAWGLVITNCTAIGAQRGFNNDTFPNYFLSVAGNNFDMPPGICVGFALIEGNPWSRFYNNTITLKSPGASGFLIDRAGIDGDNMLLDNNTVAAGGGAWTDVSWPYNFNDNYRADLIPTNIHLERNKVINGGALKRMVTLTPASVGFMSGNNLNGAPWLWPVMQPNLGWTYSPNRADFLSDGTVDILLQDSGDYIYSYSVFGPTISLPTATNPSRPLQAGWRVVGAGDINVDGKTDLFLNHADYGLAYWLMDGAVCIEAGPITYQGQPCVLGGTWKVVGVADFNGDGQPDLLMQDETTFIGIWHLKGTEIVDRTLLSQNYSGGLSGPKAVKKNQGKWRAVGTGDFNSDGRTDILFQYDQESDPRVDGQLAVWYMNDAALLATAMLDPVRPKDVKARVVATGDFYRRCAVDIMFQHKDTRLATGGALTVWSMDPSQRTHRLAEGRIAADTSLNLASRNVVGPR
jgi:hypothetical protein